MLKCLASLYDTRVWLCVFVIVRAYVCVSVCLCVCVCVSGSGCVT